MRTLRASEIGTYLYCQRAWWYLKNGEQPENQAELTGGTELHYHHGREVMISGCLRVVAYGIILVALAWIAIYFTGQFLG
ncbi:MAG: hypothetical protein P8Z00_16970 [Anaerolineales bacterium]|jgi:hypothetical protein